MASYDIYGIGAALVDTEIEVNDQDLSAFGIDKGQMTLVDETRQKELMKQLQGHLVTSKRASGGSAANTVIAAQYFGGQTYYCCKVADDDNGHFYIADMNAAGVTLPNNCVSLEGHTGKCLVMITDDAERTMNTFLGISEQLSEEQVDEAALAQARFLYLEGYLVTSATGRPAALKAYQMAQKHGVTITMSLSDPGIVEFFYDGLVEMIGEGVDLLFCNQAEALKFTGCESLEDAAEALKQYAKTIAITRGAEGAMVFDGHQWLHRPSPKVKALDTNGAGDMFAGAFLFALSQGASYGEATELANRAAAQVVSQYGPRLAPAQHRALLEPSSTSA